MNDLSLTVSRKIAAPAERVFNAWLNPEKIAEFMRPMPGMEAPDVKNDPVEGGAFEIIMKAGDDTIPHKGIYKEINRHSRLVFTWESPFSIEDSTVTLDFNEVDGATDVTLTHVKFPSEESRDNHNSGWTQILETLSAAA